jgi:hypothetical protein
MEWFAGQIKAILKPPHGPEISLPLRRRNLP